MEMISKGTLNSSLVHPREVFKGALLANAHALILAHNHPSGNVEPSSADRQVTDILVKAGNILDVKILDHVIIGSKEGYYSFRENSCLLWDDSLSLFLIDGVYDSVFHRVSH
jgi:DNA repair protein RadC